MFLRNLELGMPPVQAAAAAGSKDPSQYCYQVQSDPAVRKAMARIAEKHAKEAEMSREKVQKVVTDAIDMARVLEDPQSMIRGASELNKMCGYYAPEQKEVTISAKVQRLKTEFEEMSEQDLLAAIGEELDPLEAEFYEIDPTLELEYDGSREKDL